MPKIDWKVSIDDQTYSIAIEHGLLTGSRKIWVNGELIGEWSHNLSDNGSIHRLTLGKHSSHILVSRGLGLHFYYQLFIDGRPAEYEDNWWFTGHQKQAAFYQREQIAWETVGKKTGLTYLPDLNYFPEGISRHFFPIHRLFGKFQGFFTKVSPAVYSYDNIITLIVLFRHAEIENPNNLQKVLRDDPQVIKWLSRFRKKEDAIIVNNDVTYLYLPTNLNEEFIEILSDQISHLAKVIGQYAKPLPDNCEGKGISHADTSTLKWVLINGFPFLYCQKCIKQVPELAKKNQEALKPIPSEIYRSIIFELIALVVCLALFIMLIPINDIVLVLAICLFAAVIPTVIGKASKKITKTGMLIAYGFTTLYNGLVLVYFLIHQFTSGAGSNWSANLFWTLLSHLSRNLLIILLFSAIPAFVVPLILDYKRSQQKENLRPYLHPTVEILPSNIVCSIDTK